MKEISIPLLGKTILVNPIAGSIFGIPIYWYAIFIVASMVIAMIIYDKNDGKYGIHYEDIIDLALILIPVSFLCARIYYIVFNLKDYTTWCHV